MKVQKVKVHRHVSSPLAPVERRFRHIHIDIVEPLPVSSNAKYLLTCIDRLSRWSEAWPLENVSVHAIVVMLVSQWILRFGVPDFITTDQGQQFEADLMKSLASTFGIHNIRTIRKQTA